MAKKKPLLEQMRANPRGDWTIDHIAKLCKETGMELARPKRGSHFGVASDYLRDNQTVPCKRPIKPLYIKQLVGYTDAHIEAGKQADE